MKMTIAALALAIGSSPSFAMCLGTNCPPPPNPTTQFLHQWQHDQTWRALQNAQPSAADPADAMRRLHERMHQESMSVHTPPPQPQGPSMFDVVAEHMRRDQLHAAQLRMLEAQRKAYEAQAARNGDNECVLGRESDGKCFRPKRVGGGE